MAEASLTSLEMTAIGAVSGTVEVCIMQPTVAVKNAIQEGRPIPRAPAGLYRGLLVRLTMPRIQTLHGSRQHGAVLRGRSGCGSRIIHAYTTVCLPRTKKIMLPRVTKSLLCLRVGFRRAHVPRGQACAARVQSAACSASVTKGAAAVLPCGVSTNRRSRRPVAHMCR